MPLSECPAWFLWTPLQAGLTQEDLIRRAFAGDDVAAQFAADKAAEVEGELPQVGAGQPWRSVVGRGVAGKLGGSPGCC